MDNHPSRPDLPFNLMSATQRANIVRSIRIQEQQKRDLVHELSARNRVREISIAEAIQQVKANWPAFLESIHKGIQQINTFIPQFLEGVRAWDEVVEIAFQEGFFLPYSLVDHELIERQQSGADSEELVRILVEGFSPGGRLFPLIENAFETSPALAERLVEAQEVIEAFKGGKYYLTVCGAIPLIEYILHQNAGGWKSGMDDYLSFLPRTMNDFEQIEDYTIIDYKSFDIAERLLSKLWKRGSHKVHINEDLRRHRILHGTAYGWNTKENGIRILLLVVATSTIGAANKKDAKASSED